MNPRGFAFAFALLPAFATAVLPAQAQGVRTSTWEADTSMRFQDNIMVLSRSVKTAEACRDICLGNRLCTAWSYFGAFPDAHCFIGAGVKGRTSGAAGKTSGEIK
jgi:hypothetical protein